MNGLSILSFILSNIRWFALGSVVFIGSIFIWNTVSYIRTSAQNEIRVEQYKANEEVYQELIDSKNDIIELQKQSEEIASDVLTERDHSIDELRDRKDQIVSDDLGSDLKDQAPESIKELIRRMSEK